MSGPQRRSVIIGTGSELPNKVITNEDLEKMVDTSDEWITVRTGIKERRVLEEGKGNADMAYRAAQRALADAGVEANDLDAIIMGTVTPHSPVPHACSKTCWARGALSRLTWAPRAPAFSMRYRWRTLLSEPVKPIRRWWW